MRDIKARRPPAPLSTMEYGMKYERSSSGYFKLFADDGHRYVLRYDGDEQIWELVMREATALDE